MTNPLWFLSIISFFTRLKRRTITFKAMKTILFFLPIFGIVHEIYLKRYGAYVMDFDFKAWFSEHPTRAAFAIGCFALIYVVAILFEEFVLPAIGVVFSGHIKGGKVNEYKKMIAPYIYRIAPRKELREIARDMEGTLKYEFHTSVSFVPMTFLLWSCWLTLHYSVWYFGVTLTILVFHWWCMRVLNTAWKVLAK